jgi:hypothetical protein
MVKTLILGLKNVIFVMLSMDSQKQNGTQPPQPKVPKQTDEVKLFLSLFKHGLNCFPVYTMGSNPSPADEKEVPFVSTIQLTKSLRIWMHLRHFLQSCQ